MSKLEPNPDKLTELNLDTQTEQNPDTQTESEKSYGINPDHDFDLSNVASSTDLTGLIPATPSSREEEKSYGNMYEYEAQDMTIPKSEDDNTEKK